MSTPNPFLYVYQVLMSFALFVKSLFAEKEEKSAVQVPRIMSSADLGFPSVFVDLDGTLVRTEMGHTIFKFALGVPNPYQRAWLVLITPVVAISAKIASFFSEGLAIKILAFACLRGVSVEDVEFTAHKAVAPALRKAIRPHILAEIKRHQLAGRKVAILTGSLEPIVKPFCESLGCVCIGTIPEMDPTGTFYTGYLAQEPNVSTSKVHHVESTGHSMNDLYGYGNTKNDIPFLAKTGNPFIVNPDKKLHRHASLNGWDDKFARVAQLAN